MSQSFPIDAIRAQFPVLNREVHGKPLAYFDSAASAHKPLAVIEAQAKYLAERHSNIHRGVHALAQEATEAYEAARRRCAPTSTRRPPRRCSLWLARPTASTSLPKPGAGPT